VRNLRVSVAGQVGQARCFAQRIEIDGLRAPGGFAGEGEALAPGKGIDRARLADVGTPDESQLGRAGRRQVTRARGGREEPCLRE